MRLADEVPAEVRDEQYRLQPYRKHRRVPELAGSSPEKKLRDDEGDDAPLKRDFEGFEKALFHFFIVEREWESLRDTFLAVSFFYCRTGVGVWGCV